MIHGACLNTESNWCDFFADHIIYQSLKYTQRKEKEKRSTIFQQMGVS